MDLIPNKKHCFIFFISYHIPPLVFRKKNQTKLLNYHLKTYKIQMADNFVKICEIIL